MDLLETLIEQTARALAGIKAYDLPHACVELGLATGEESEAYDSKYKYVLKRVRSLPKEEAIILGRKAVQQCSSYELQETLDLIAPPLDGTISAITRRNLIDALSDIGALEGKLYVGEFLKRIFPLEQMAYHGTNFFQNTLADGVDQHMVRNDDWTYKDFFDYADGQKLSERRFRLILEEIVHPEVRTGDEQKRFVDVINTHIARDGFELVPADQISGYFTFRVVKKGGVAGHAKNLIFAADGPKPELVLADALNNDIRIVKNQEYCLVYDRPIGLDGLRWKELVEWWASFTPSQESERDLYWRLAASLGSEAEKIFFKLYFEILRDSLKEQLPAIIPQVYLHYDPYTLREQPTGSPLVRQRMDFLLLLPSRQRVVIEVDGKQHYADGDTASPKHYAGMVAEDRNLRLLGYGVYRFGGYELMKDKARAVVEPFLKRLMKRN
jgi:very-short-patch-repair endonuclease